jgi:hypothetical protein
MMRRRAFVVRVIAAIAAPLAAPLAAGAQRAQEVWRVGYLSVVSVDTDKSWVTALRDGLREHGY